MDFQKLNIATKKNPYPLHFMEEVLDMMVGHKIYWFLDGFMGVSSYNDRPKKQVQNHLHHKLGSICLDSHAFWIKKSSTNLPASNEYGIL
jgi:hypothetical protein